MYKKVIAVMVAALWLSGCASDGKREIASNSSVNKVIQEQMSKAEVSAESKPTENGTEEDGISESEAKDLPETELITDNSTEIASKNDSEVDIDLTQMDRTMTYATVYQLMIYPEKYVGQTIKMTGEYYAIFYEKTNKYYHYVLIKDATECCTQGLEFVWEDGNHVYPDDYPADTTQVEVTGVFETYMEEDDPNLYSRLKDAEFVVVE